MGDAMPRRLAERNDGDETEVASILSKATDVLNAFTRASRSMTLSELARASGLAKSTVHRVAARLVEIGALDKRGDYYSIGMGMFSLGALSAEMTLREIAMPHLEALHMRTGQTVHLAVLRGASVIYLEKLQAPGAHRSPSTIGGDMPAHATAVGKVLLAADIDKISPVLQHGDLVAVTSRTIIDPVRLHSELRAVRAHGFAVEREEAAVGLACVAAPIRVHNSTVAALSVAFPALSDDSRVRDPLRATATNISRSLTSHCREGRLIID